jgi:hypothetical protein
MLTLSRSIACNWYGLNVCIHIKLKTPETSGESRSFQGVVLPNGKYFLIRSHPDFLQIYANDRKKVAWDKKTLD